MGEERLEPSEAWEDARHSNRGGRSLHAAVKGKSASDSWGEELSGALYSVSGKMPSMS